MKKLTVTTHLYMFKHSWSTEWELRASDIDPRAYRPGGQGDSWHYLRAVKLEAEEPTREALINGEIENLKIQIHEKRVECSRTVDALEERISKLRCLEHERGES